MSDFCVAGRVHTALAFFGPIGLVTLALLPDDAQAAGRQIHRSPYTEAAVNNAALHPNLLEHTSGPGVLRLQILLDRAHFSVGQIDGNLGSNTMRALAGFRKQRQLGDGRGVDQAVWKSLNEDAEPAIVAYTVTSADLKGPFMKIPPDMMSQAKLDYLGYASPLDQISERFHVSPGLLKQLSQGKQFTLAGEKVLVPNVGTDVSGVAAKVVVSKSANTVTAYDAGGKILAQYPCSSGSDHDPLPIGEWKILGIAKNPIFNYNPELFWDAKQDDAKATIPAGPRNPVGVVWIDLSKEHYGIHGTPDPSLIGRNQSHGCIRLTNWDAAQLASLVKPGIPAELVE